jgi:hypothetical protein
MFVLSPSQLPRAISLTVKSDSILCVEIIGYFIERLDINKGDWLLILEEDHLLTLTSQVMIRGPHGVNSVVGLPDTSDFRRVRNYAENCVSTMKDISVLPSISFTRDIVSLLFEEVSDVAYAIQSQIFPFIILF